jgi:carbon storage regulator
MGLTAAQALGISLGRCRWLCRGREIAMPYLTRKLGEAVILNHDIEVRMVAIFGRSVKLGFTFPPEASVLREEVVEAIELANRAAANAAGALPAVVGMAARLERQDPGPPDR